MKKRKGLIIIIGAVLLLSFLVFRCAKGKGQEVKVIKVSRGKLTVTVSATGTVRSNNEALLTATSTGRVSRIYVTENQFIRKGTLILELDTAAQAEKDYQRFKNLGGQGFVNAQSVEQAKKQYESTVIIAPFSGTLAKIFIKEGETLLAGAQAALLADLGNMLVETNIDETDIGKVNPGQPALVVLDAYKNEKLPGRVSFVAKTSLEVKEKGITYLVKVSLNPAKLVLRLGMTGDVDIMVAEKENVLMLPFTAIGDDKKGNFVFALKNNKLVRKDIATGLESYDYTEIVSGVNENDVVVESDISKLKEGARAKISKKK